MLMGAVLVAGVGGVSDLRSARIPNWLTYSAALAAMVLRAGLLGWLGLKEGVTGLLIAVLPFFLLFVIGAMGGGDVKLMSAVGAWAGASHVVQVLVAAALAGGFLAVLYTIFGQGIGQTFRNLCDLVRFRLISGLHPHPVLNVRTTKALRVPFGVAIAMGTAFCAGNAIWWR